VGNHIDLGKKGEAVAQAYLSEKGYELRVANYRFQHLEIDLIFEYAQSLIIVEVKARNTTEYGEPYEAVTRQKQKQLIKAANQYIEEEDLYLEVRFDIVSILFQPDGSHQLTHIEDAFTP
jgi:putative endonuclease